MLCNNHCNLFSISSRPKMRERHFMACYWRIVLVVQYYYYYSWSIPGLDMDGTLRSSTMEAADAGVLGQQAEESLCRSFHDHSVGNEDNSRIFFHEKHGES
jgi:hypothetical protein